MVTTEASSKIAGYTFQFQRALYRVFSSEIEGAIVGIETDDDVVEVVQNADGSVNIIFEQDKHSIQNSGHPFQDSSKNLWHTLHIWLDAMEETRKKYKKIDYCLVTNKEVTTRSFAKKLGSAQKKDEINACIKEIRQRAAKAKGEGADSIKAVATFSDGDLYFLIENLKLMDEYATASGSDPRDATIQLFQLPPDLHAKGSDIYRNLLGLLVDTCQTVWLQKQQVWIDKNIFTKRLNEDIAAYLMDRYLERPLFSTPYKELIKNNSRDHLFLEQLQRVGALERQCDNALGHYWGFYAERVRLQDEGVVLPSAWEDRNQLLHQRWQTIEENVALEALEADVTVTDDNLAKRVYIKTIDGNFTAPLGKHATSHHYFTAGNYHDLANQSGHACFVYWHPSYKPQKKDEE